MGGRARPVTSLGEAQGFWRFDDCNMDRTELFDSSFFGNHTAFRSVTAFCRPGVLNTGIGFDEDDDLVLVPDQPNFVFSEGFTVAAWVKPTGARRRPHDLPQASGGHEHVRARRERQELPDRHQPRQRQGGRRAGPGDARQVHARRRDLRRHLPQALPRREGGRLEARRRPAQRRRGPAAHGQRRQPPPHRRHHRQRRLRHAPGERPPRSRS